MRMVAGPNGSGKSTLIELLKRSVDLGVYVNADDIEANLNKKPLLHFDDYSIKTHQTAFRSFIQKKATLGSADFKSSIANSVSIQKKYLLLKLKL